MRTIIILAIISLLLLTTSSASDVGVTQAIITTGVTSGAQPQTSNLTVVDYRVGSITFYTEIVGLNGQTISHVWFFKGKQISSVTLVLGSARSINWSRSSVAPSQTGQWEARVVDTGGRVLASRAFDVVQSNRSVATIVQKQQIDSCSVKLAQLGQKMADNPDVDYYKFLYDKQASRCN
jgi:hypothetical protein